MELADTSYALPVEMHEFQEGDRYLFFDPVNFIWFQTDRLGKGVLDGLVNNGQLDDAALEVARLADAPFEDAKSYAGRTIDQLLDLGFLHRGEYERIQWRGGVAGSPFIIYLHMTSRCNLKCPYCYNQDNRTQLWKEAVGSYEQYVSLIDEAAELGFKEAKFTGGEPLLNKDTLRLARYAREKGLWINLLTNGTLVTEDNVKEIAEVVHTVSLSLDSPHAEEHDAVRGKGTWLQVLRAIHLLREAGVNYIHLNSVVNPINKNSVGEFLEYAWDELEAQKVTLAPTGIDVPDPEGKFGAFGSMISPEDLWAVHDAQRSFQRKKAGKTTPVVSNTSLRTRQCGAGNGLVSVDSNGDLYPCQTMHTPELKCGNVFETSLRDVISTSELLSSVRNLTVDRLEDCPTCPMRNMCAGGCRMEAYSREGRLTARNRDMCPLFFQRALDKLWTTASLSSEQRNEAGQRSTPLEFFESYS